MVVYEAARAICNLPGVEMNDLSPAITVLQVRSFVCQERVHFVLGYVLYYMSKIHFVLEDVG